MNEVELEAHWLINSKIFIEFPSSGQILWQSWECSNLAHRRPFPV